MRRFFNWFGSLRKPIPWIIGGVIVLFFVVLAVTVSATTWEYTNSPEFCGTTCHTMPPEYTAYQISPHARVDCVDCHLGQESFLTTVPRKAREISHVVNALTQAYEPPIYVKSLRPARDTCEKCHNPDKFSSDTFVEIKSYAEDEENTETRNYMIVKTGGGSGREGLGKGIHWHIENEVWYYTDDPLKQTIPYVREVTNQGTTIEYFDVEAGLPPDFGVQVEDQLQRMDCIDCHTRISHLFRSPSDAMDDAIARMQIDSSIPFIKQKGVEILSQEYASNEEGQRAIRELEDWYEVNYPDYYRDNQIAMQKAIRSLQEIFTVTVFPNLEVGWQTHPNNAGHKEFPGCFRCHDGKHTSPQGKTVRLECNVCHSIPEVVEGEGVAPVLSVDNPGEPASHKDSNWLARHRYVFDETCATCHTVSNPGGTDNSSFCSNGACHGTEWKFVGLNAPAISKLVAPPPVPGDGQPKRVPHPIGPQTDCMICHGAEAVLPVPADHASYEQTLCTQCHPSALVDQATASDESAVQASGETSETSVGTGIPAIPHPLEGRDDCVVCHGPDGFKPYPADHEGRSVTSCTACHKPAIQEEAGGQEEAAVEATPTAVQEEATPGAEQEEPAGPPRVPHDLAGREDCLVCHGADGFKPYPADHEGRSVDTCLNCHQTGTADEPAPEVPPAATATPTRAAATATPTGEEATATPTRAAATATPTRAATPTATQAAAGATSEPEEEEKEEGGIPTIPHSVADREGTCLACHMTGSVKPFPADHEGRTNEACLACHQPGSEE